MDYGACGPTGHGSVVGRKLMRRGRTATRRAVGARDASCDESSSEGICCSGTKRSSSQRHDLRQTVYRSLLYLSYRRWESLTRFCTYLRERKHGSKRRPCYKNRCKNFVTAIQLVQAILQCRVRRRPNICSPHMYYSMDVCGHGYRGKGFEHSSHVLARFP